MIGSIIRSMVIEMNESRLTSIEQLRAVDSFVAELSVFALMKL